MTNIVEKTRQALSCVAEAGLTYIPAQVPTVYKASLTFFGDNVDLLASFARFGYVHTNGREQYKLHIRSDISLLYEISVVWRAAYRTDTRRCKCAAAFKYSYLTLNKTDGGFEVRLPDNHELTEKQEGDLRAYALANQDVFDDVIGKRALAPISAHSDHQGQEEEPPSKSEDEQAEKHLQGSGDWAREMQ